MMPYISYAACLGMVIRNGDRAYICPKKMDREACFLESTKAYAMHQDELYAFAGGEGGLSSSEAARRLASRGPNELPKEKPASALARFMEQLADPMVVILLVAATISALFGEWTDSGVIAVVVALTAALGMYQEGKAARAAEA